MNSQEIFVSNAAKRFSLTTLALKVIILNTDSDELLFALVCVCFVLMVLVRFCVLCSFLCEISKAAIPINTSCQINSEHIVYFVIIRNGIYHFFLQTLTPVYHIFEFKNNTVTCMSGSDVIKFIFFFQIAFNRFKLINYYHIRKSEFVSILHICNMKIGIYHGTLSFII